MKWPKVTYCFDIDGVVCTVEGGDYRRAKPLHERIKLINEIYFQEKTKIIFFTARGTVTGKDWREVTERQFKEWGLLYDEIIFGKPFYNFIIDDKAIGDKDFFKTLRRNKRQSAHAVASGQAIPGSL